MTRILPVFLCAAVIVLMITAGCFSNTKGANPLESPTATPVPATTAAAQMPVATAANTQAPGTCVADISSDAANCGGCGYACPANALCQQGQCYCRDGYTVENNACVVASAGTGTGTGNGCPTGMSPCPDGYCYELAADAANCGICGNQCPAGMICSASTCTNVPTESTTAPVTTTTTGATTTVTTTTTPTSTVTGLSSVTPGGFTLSCAVLGLTKCDGSCVNLTTSNGNCGSCGHICSGLTATCCGGSCTSLKSDESNCGTCGHKCGAFATCEEGSCKVKAVVTGKVVVTPKISLKVTVPVYQEPIQIPQPGY